MTPKLDKIKQMIKDHEKKGYAAEFNTTYKPQGENNEVKGGKDE